MSEIAIFPIPNCVAFPGVTFPLHVFEPRYRKMVDDCVKNDIPLGIAHTQKIIQEAKPKQSLDEALHSNQSTFKPYPIFSAGKCRVIELLHDGRMRVDVDITQRFFMKKERQTLPYIIYDCDTYDDIPLEEDIEEQKLQKEKILRRLSAITANVNGLQAIVKSSQWEEKTPREFSMQIMGLLRGPADWQQSLLESRSTKERLDTILDALNQAPAKLQ